MKRSVCLQVPQTVTIRSSDGSDERNYADYYGFTDLARQLEELGEFVVRFVGVGDSLTSCDVLLASELSYQENNSETPTLLLDVLPNSYIQLGRAGLLGAVTAGGLGAWRSDFDALPSDALVGRRDIARLMGAAEGTIMGPPDYCFVSRNDLTTLPRLINEFLANALRAES